MIKRWGLISVVVFLAATMMVVSCKRKTTNGNNGPDEEPAKKPEYKSKADEGVISGKILFNGIPPAPAKLDMNAEPTCAAENPGALAEDIVVTDGKLANAFVYLRGGPADRFTFPISGSGSLDQKGCRYIPHVLGLQVGQTLTITNSDRATHNIHPTPKSNPEWNESQPQGSPAKEKKFTRRETLIPVKCNIHPWMRAYIGVLDHPFYAVSAKDGSYKIENVPPGDYTLVVWHENTKLGEQTAKITVPAKGTVPKIGRASCRERG